MRPPVPIDVYPTLDCGGRPREDVRGFLEVGIVDDVVRENRCRVAVPLVDLLETNESRFLF